MGKKKVAKTKTISFEESLAELETIVSSLESGKLGLEESLEQYEQGVRHLKFCYSQLNSAERRIELVSKVDSTGRVATESYEDAEESSLQEKGDSRSRKRTAKPKSKRSAARTEVDDETSLF